MVKVPEPVMSVDDIHKFVEGIFPMVKALGIRIESLERGRVVTRFPILGQHLRPGGSVAGPILMTVADTAMFFLLLSSIGPVAGVYTTSLNINFLERPEQRDILAEATLMKLGKRLAVGNVIMRSEGSDEPIAIASVSYSIPTPKAAATARNSGGPK